MSLVGVIDFETTGLSPAMGDRATEIAIVMMDGTRVVGRFQSLMNAGVRIPAFIEQYTGITNEMVRAAPPAADVMAEAARFVQGAPLVAHNASFDQRFWSAELGRLGPDAAKDHAFACTMLLARRLYPHAGSYRLQSLASFHALAPAGRAHRALADAEVAAALLARSRTDLQSEYALHAAPHELLVKLQRTQRKALPKAIAAYFSQ
ncbi:3'-5' exonuclease [Ramlibacter ginsenosidimutans]|uniref:3'-5' exonuclease n=1 Tax=Ramlibacter ginsenosidimutans TaxID=502333 RepID=A0A934WLG7_9BURK|nr:3'-5' exonuclease [Ramlibacter ginsenosidimutans]MBK6005615.1 3'-5' exonuclease [Ramlibacter ginsenosidimutans]